MPRNVFDQASRYAARLDPVKFLSWAIRVESSGFRFAGWLDTRAIPFPGEPDQICDTVARLENPLVLESPWAVPIEFQLEPDPQMFGRFMSYLSQLWLQLRPDPERGSRYQLGAILINLTGAGDASREMRWPAIGLATRLAIVERNLSREDADELLSNIEAGRHALTLLPWIP